MPMDLVIQQFVTAVESFPYLAVPFFIMVGSIMNYSGISEELMAMAGRSFSRTHERWTSTSKLFT